MIDTLNQPRRIGLFTSGRQDWSILQPVAKAVAAHPDLRPTIFLSGTHHHTAFGLTHRAVRACGLECVDVPAAAQPDGPAEQFTRPEGLACMATHLAAVLDEHPVDVMVVLGDRIETLMGSVVVVAAQRFLAHIHGGDRAASEFDDAARHAITKLAHVHFPATRSSADRIARMGEPADRIHVVGSPSIDGVLADGVAAEAQARAAVGLTPGEPFVVLLYHPAGLGDAAEAQAASEVCRGVEQAGLRAVCLEPNADPGRTAVRNALRDFSSAHNWPIAPTVDRPVFLGLIRCAVALVGNSSAGMVESAAANAAVLDVGARQAGREHSGNVLHVPAEASRVAQALKRLRQEPELSASLRSAPCVFGDGQASRRIAEVLARVDLAAARRIKLNEY